MSDTEIRTTAERLAKLYPQSRVIPTDRLEMDADGQMTVFSPPPDPIQSSPIPSGPLPQPPTIQQVAHMSISHDSSSNEFITNEEEELMKLEEHLNLVFPLYMPQRKQLISRAICTYRNPTVEGYTQLLRDLIYVGGREITRNHDRSRSRTQIRKPPCETVEAKLLSLKTKTGQAMFTKSWCTFLYQHCNADTLERLIKAQFLGDLSRSIKNKKGREVNAAIVEHLKLLNQW